MSHPKDEGQHAYEATWQAEIEPSILREELAEVDRKIEAFREVKPTDLAGAEAKLNALQELRGRRQELLQKMPPGSAGALGLTGGEEKTLNALYSQALSLGVEARQRLRGDAPPQRPDPLPPSPAEGPLGERGVRRGRVDQVTVDKIATHARALLQVGNPTDSEIFKALAPQTQIQATDHELGLGLALARGASTEREAARSRGKRARQV